MLCEAIENEVLRLIEVVLILVLMEYALRGGQKPHPHPRTAVLILVLMEYALRGSKRNAMEIFRAVLILVLMEYALRGTGLFCAGCDLNKS